ncbi:MAG: hypothetical protein EON59_13670 [Alphaproteobacteria bacterium]|nr:MAG: hypothetical protein EON59_13670 [Alphaproteobacteria bacterium]
MSAEGADKLSDADKAILLKRHGVACTKIVIIHGLQCDVTFARAITPYIPREFPILAFRAPGVTGLEAPLATLGQMAQRYVADADIPNGPTVLVGFCAGAAIAKQMAQDLTLVGVHVDHLVIIDMARTTKTEGFNRIAEEQIAVARRRETSRPDIPESRGGVATVTAFVKALRDYANLAGQPHSYHGAATVFATRESARAMVAPDIGWIGVLDGTTPIHVIADNRESLVSKAGLEHLGSSIGAIAQTIEANHLRVITAAEA